MKAHIGKSYGAFEFELRAHNPEHAVCRHLDEEMGFSTAEEEDWGKVSVGREDWEAAGKTYSVFYHNQIADEQEETAVRVIKR